MSGCRRRWMFQLKQRTDLPCLLLFFYSGSQWIRWCPPAMVRMSSLLSTPTQMLISFRDTDIPRNNILLAISIWHPLAQSHWHIKLTIIGPNLLPWWLSGKESACNAGDLGLIPWRGRWKPRPVFLPGRSHEQRSFAGYSPRSHKRIGQDWVTKQQGSKLLTMFQKSKATTDSIPPAS